MSEGRSKVITPKGTSRPPNYTMGMVISNCLAFLPMHCSSWSIFRQTIKQTTCLQFWNIFITGSETIIKYTFSMVMWHASTPVRYPANKCIQFWDYYTSYQTLEKHASIPYKEHYQCTCIIKLLIHRTQSITKWLYVMIHLLIIIIQ